MKNNKDLTDIAGFVDDELLCECYERREQRKKKRKRLSMVSATAASLAVIVAVSAILPGIMNREEPTATAESSTAESTEAPVFPIEREGPYPWEDGYTGDQHGSGGMGGSSGECPEHGFTYYHSIGGGLYTLVGQENINKWRKEHEIYGIDGFCNTYINIKNFVDDFGISREDFDEAVDLTLMPYNIDLLYTKDAEYVHEYYKNKTFISIKEGRTQLYKDLCDRLLQDRDPSIPVSGGFYCIPQLVSHHSIDRKTLEDTISKVSGDSETFNYDLDMIYNEDGTIKELPVYDENDTVLEYRGKLNEEFCRVYEDWGDPADYPADELEEEKKPVLGEGICTVHHYDYHRLYIKQAFTETYPEQYKEYLELIRSTRKEEGECILSEHDNLRAAIDFFGLSKEDVIKYFDFAYHIDIDYIMSADPKEIEEFYTDLSARETDRYKSDNYRELALFIYSYYSLPDFTAFGHNCVPYMVYEAKISRKELEAIITEVKRRREATNLYYCGFYNSFDYNLDLIYNTDGSFKKFPEAPGGHWNIENDVLYSEYNLKFCGLIPLE